MKTGLVNSKFLVKQMRLDGKFNLSDGLQVRKLINKCPWGTTSINKVTSDIYCPGIFHRHYVSSGVTFLGGADIQKQEIKSDKFLRKATTPNWKTLEIEEGWTLVTCGGTIGITAYTNKYYAKCWISQHVMRVIPSTIKKGMLYAYLTSKYGYLLLTTNTYGSVIPTLNADNIGSLPFPLFPESFQDKIDGLIQKSAILREGATDKLDQAIRLLETTISSKKLPLSAQTTSISYKQITSKFNRFDSQYQIGKKLLTAEMNGQHTVKIGSIKDSIFIGNRGKRHYVNKNGIPFLSSSDMLLANPARFCKYISKNTPGIESLLVHEGDILISRSGTVGNTIMVNKSMEGFAVSEHAMRLIVDNSKIEPEYVYAYLKTNQGQDALHILPYGSVIVTLGEEFLADVDLPIVDDNTRKRIVSLVKESNNDFATAVDKENAAISLVEQEIEKWNKS